VYFRSEHSIGSKQGEVVKFSDPGINSINFTQSPTDENSLSFSSSDQTAELKIDDLTKNSCTGDSISQNVFDDLKDDSRPNITNLSQSQDIEKKTEHSNGSVRIQVEPISPATSEATAKESVGVVENFHDGKTWQTVKESTQKDEKNGKIFLVQSFIYWFKT